MRGVARLGPIPAFVAISSGCIRMANEDLTLLAEGQQATVLQLPAEPASQDHRHTPRRFFDKSTAATTTIPIVFGIGDDPVKLGYVASLARPGGNATGINFFATEVVAKRLRLLHDLVPKAVRVAVLVNSANASVAESTLREVQEAAPTIGLQIQILKAQTIGEIDA